MNICQQTIFEPMSEDIDAKVKDLLCKCFPEDVGVFSQTRFWHGTGPKYSIILKCQDEIVGHAGVVEREIITCEEKLLVAGIQNLAISPSMRGKKLGNQLMKEAMNEAKQQNFKFGLLFCIPELEKFYNSLGWETQHFASTMLNESGEVVPIPGKNIAMTKKLTEQSFPQGDIFLNGRDW